MVKRISEDTMDKLRQLMYARYNGETEAHIRASKGYSRKHRRGSEKSYSRHAWGAAWNVRLKMKRFTPPQGSYERIARTTMMGVSRSKPWRKYLRRADKARLDPSIPYDFKRAGRDPRFGLTIEGTEIVSKEARAKQALLHFRESILDDVDMPGEDKLLGKKYRKEVRSGERNNAAKKAQNSTPSDREVGTDSLRRTYEDSTPHHPRTKLGEDALKTIKTAILEATRLSTSSGSRTASRGVRKGSSGSPAGMARKANPTRRGGRAPRVTQFGRATMAGARRATAAAALKLAARTTGHVAKVSKRLATQRNERAKGRNSLQRSTSKVLR